MKGLILILIFSSIALATFCQETIISAGTDESIYLGISNPVSSVNRKYPCEQIVVTTDNGKIVANGDCGFLWYPLIEGKGEIITYGLSGSDSVLLGSRIYNVTVLKFKLRLIPGDEKKVSLRDLPTISGPTVILDSRTSVHMIAPAITGFSILTCRENKMLFAIYNAGRDFSAETKELLKKLKPSDLLVIYDINCRSADGSIIKLEPVEYSVVE